MIALQIKEIKSFMGKLLGTECFDSFLLEEAVITTYNTYVSYTLIIRSVLTAASTGNFTATRNGKIRKRIRTSFLPGKRCVLCVLI